MPARRIRSRGPDSTPAVALATDDPATDAGRSAATAIPVSMLAPTAPTATQAAARAVRAGRDGAGSGLLFTVVLLGWGTSVG